MPIADRVRWLLSRCRLGAGVVVLVALLAGLGGDARALEPSRPGADVLHYLDRMIDWRRSVVAMGQERLSSQEVLYRDAVDSESLQALRLAFDFARGFAPLIQSAPAPTTGAASDRGRSVAQAAAAVAQRVAQLRARLDDADTRLRAAQGAEVAPAQARRDEIQADLDVAEQRSKALGEFSGFLSGRASGTSETFAQQVDELERSAPELQTPEGSTPLAAATAPAPAKSAPAQIQIGPFPMPAPTKSAADSSSAPELFRPESVGIFGLVSAMLDLSSKMSQLQDLGAHADRLRQEAGKLQDPIRAQIQAAIRRNDELDHAPDTSDVGQLNARRQELSDLRDKFATLGAVGIPLNEQDVLVSSVSTNLQQWRDTLDRQFRRCLHYLLLRVGVMVGAIVLVLALSKLWRRATFRYVSDIRRRRQFLVVRRIVVGTLITLIVIATFVTEFGSLATFAGIITAGIAVALQSFIVSGVAYFFFIGRYGVRVGERVTLSGITGEVVDIGLFRLYLMELGGTGLDLHPTGRICVFSNSVLFQPAAFFKQIPGADYTWRQASVSLAPGAGAAAEQRLMAAVESVYSGYRADIERQHAAVTRAIHVQIDAPHPQGRLHFTPDGIEYVMRYPVDLRSGAEIDEQMSRRLLDEINREPRLPVTGTGVPRIAPAA